MKERQRVPAGGLVVSGPVQSGTFPTAQVPVDSPAVGFLEMCCGLCKQNKSRFQCLSRVTLQRDCRPFEQNPPLSTDLQILLVLRR